MVVIPGINCQDFKCVSDYWDKAAGLGVRAVQIDVADGEFAPVRTWNNPSELAGLIAKNPQMEAEIHLMAENPEPVFEKWLDAGVKRLVIHIESAGNLESIREIISARGAGIIWGIKSGTDVRKLEGLLKNEAGDSVQFLDVSPGFSGQSFNAEVIDAINFLRERHSDLDIRVDGGINPETAKMAKEAGANAAIAVSYIWKSASPAEAYQELIRV